MKHIIFTVAMLLCTTVVVSQTRVEKKTATKSTGYGVQYSLPKTSLIVNAEITKTTCKAGPYYKYAEKYLGVKDAVTENDSYYELKKISLVNKGIPDKENTYVVEFKAGTVAPYVYLTEDGLLCAINAEYTPTESAPDKDVKDAAQKVNTTAVLTEELLMAGSVARQAEVAAKQIYHIRESRMDILTGDAEKMPPDGEAMKQVIKQLEDQEKALTYLFIGTRESETDYFDVTILPQEDMEKEVIFRFSRKLGILDADDLGGAPVYMNLKATTARQEELSPKEAEKKEKATKGLIYCVPGKASVEIKTDQKTFFKGETLVVQFGSYENFAPVLFEDKKNPVKIFFHPETGSLKQIIQ
ncbi:MAG: DUF4831 family protein [Tannerella sp.]|jgi:hypothetical protein|nr:DUF4831 family protein [Tannerella sp.]